MTPMLHPSLVNGRCGDPALFVEMLHRREALLFDAGDLSPLSARDLLRVGHVFVSHMHMDHFIGFDALLRANIGREKTILIAGPAGIADRVGHKLQGYDWDLAERYNTELLFDVVEIGPDGPTDAASFSFRKRFQRERLALPLSLDAAGLKVETALLEHHGACLGFAISEPAHVNVWKSRLDERGLATGPWLQELKRAVVAREPDDYPIRLAPDDCRPLGELRDLVTVSRGQKLAYVTDVADTPANRSAIAQLARGADLLFIESRFAAADAAAARDRAHLTTQAAGEIARAAGVRRIEPFHFSPRYDGEEERMVAEVLSAFEAPEPALEPA
jgi:ribonuclease Z